MDTGASLADDTLLDDCANHARQIASALCVGDPETGESCSWYHGFWPRLRALGIVTTPDTHRAFYLETLRALASQRGFRRILISGSADFNMLQQVHAAFDLAGASPEIAFVDRCPTPVALAEWYAERFGRTVEGHVGDILKFFGAPFDIVCTHSFMGYFNDAARQTLLSKWAALLRPGGKVVTINRIRPGATGVIGFTPQQEMLFAEKVRRAACARSLPSGLDADDIARAAARYAAKFRIHPIASVDGLRDMFEANGFATNRLAETSVPGHEGRRGSGPTTPDGAVYAHLIATRL
jgi:SAM-dependent methyltransferase